MTHIIQWLPSLLGAFGFLGSIVSAFVLLQVRNLMLRNDLTIEKLQLSMTRELQREMRLLDSKLTDSIERQRDRYASREEVKMLESKCDALFSQIHTLKRNEMSSQ
jgi:hypothetical protein